MKGVSFGAPPAAEMPDAPLLLLRLASSRSEFSRLVDWLRASGLGAEGHVPRPMLLKALTIIGVRSPTMEQQLADVFAALDPERSGAIGFTALCDDLRRIRRQLQQMSAQQQPEPKQQRPPRPPRPGSAPSRGEEARRRPGSASSRSDHGEREDPEVLSHALSEEAAQLEQQAADLRQRGQLSQALRALEEALARRCRARGERSEEAAACSRQVADVCNSLGMQLLQRDDFTGCHTLLKRAQARASADASMTAITLNNLACYHRRRGHLKVALSLLTEAVEIERGCETPQKPADTHLNLCAVQAELGLHSHAMANAKQALKLLRDELGSLGVPVAAAPGRGGISPSSSAGVLTGSAALDAAGGAAAEPEPLEPLESASAERIAVLAIAHHNLAVEQEALGLAEEAFRSYSDASRLASSRLGRAHPVSAALRAAVAELTRKRKQRAQAASVEAERARQIKVLEGRRRRPASAAVHGRTAAEHGRPAPPDFGQRARPLRPGSAGAVPKRPAGTAHSAYGSAVYGSTAGPMLGAQSSSASNRAKRPDSAKGGRALPPRPAAPAQDDGPGAGLGAWETTLG